MIDLLRLAALHRLARKVEAHPVPPGVRLIACDIDTINGVVKVGYLCGCSLQSSTFGPSLSSKRLRRDLETLVIFAQRESREHHASRKQVHPLRGVEVKGTDGGWISTKGE